GGLAGANVGTISGAVVAGSISAPKYTFAGGVAGLNVGIITRSQSGADVTAGANFPQQYFSYAGGLVGESDGGEIDTSYATGNVAANYGAGGLVGFAGGIIMNSYSTGSVQATQVA